MIIGITGNSGSGKTLLSNLLKKEFKANVIDADKVVKEMSVSGNIYFNEIIGKFGKDILLADGEIDKQKLSKIIFENSKKRELLNSITFQYVVEEIKKRIKTIKADTVIIDAPLLIESNLNKICDVVVSVLADESVKIQRICKRDNINEQTAKTRIECQPDDIFYKMNSNYVIINNNNYDLKKHLESIKEIIQSEIIKNNDVVIIQDGDFKILNFKELLKHSEFVSHAFTLKPFNFGSNDTYKEIKNEADANYKTLCDLLNLDSKNIIRPYQTHSKNIKAVKNQIGIFNKDYINIDGIITNKKDRVLSLTYADCTPLYLFDKSKKIIGNIHSGWQGTTKKIAREAIKFMKEKYNCNPKDIICVIGPTIRKCHFEVKKDVRDIFYNEFSYMKNIDKIIEYSKETESYYIDTVEINKNLLQEEGILHKNIIDSNVCTVCNSNIIHSYRKEGEKAGRNTAIICLI